MTALNEAMKALRIPARMRRLPISPRGYPVPWFVQWMKDGEPVKAGEGEPDFRVMDSSKLRRAIAERRCWVCGDRLGSHLTFTIGPMCAVNRTTAEPPSHHECAAFSAIGCPFLTKPKMKRNDKDMPEGQMPGIGLLRNPGVTCLWTTRTYQLFRAGGAPGGNEGILVKLGKPENVEWFAEGKPATREQVMASIDSGYPLLLDMANEDGPDAVAELSKMRAAAMALVPS
jgi:hypothetical protein